MTALREPLSGWPGKVLAKLRDSWPARLVLLRNSVSLLGILLFDWNPVEVTASLYLNSLTQMWALALLLGCLFANWFSAKPANVFDWIEYGGTVLGGFLLFSAIFSWMVIVPGFMAWIYVIASTPIDWKRLATDGTLWIAAAQMFALRLPWVVRTARSYSLDRARPHVEREMFGNVLRVILIAMAAKVLGFLPARWAAAGLAILSLTVFTAIELLREDFDRLLPRELAASGPSAATALVKRRRSRR